MDMKQGVIIFGANGSGKTTLGREVARILNYKHMDIEDYFFKKSEIPYAVTRSREEYIGLMLADIEKHPRFVITAVTGDFGDAIPRFYKLAVHLSVPANLRVQRVKQRSYERFGERIDEGGDMYEQEAKFFEFVATRPLSGIDTWAKSLTCPLIHADGRLDWRTNAIDIVERFYAISK